MGDRSHIILSWVLSIVVGIIIGWIALCVAYFVVGILMAIISPESAKAGRISRPWDMLAIVLAYLFAYSWSKIGVDYNVTAITAGFTILVLVIRGCSKKKETKECGTQSTTQSLADSTQVVGTARA